RDTRRPFPLGRARGGGEGCARGARRGSRRGEITARSRPRRGSRPTTNLRRARPSEFSHLYTWIRTPQNRPGRRHATVATPGEDMRIKSNIKADLTENPTRRQSRLKIRSAIKAGPSRPPWSPELMDQKP